MTFILSKLIWVFLRPLNALLLLAGIAFVFGLLGFKKIRLMLTSVALLLFLGFGYTNITDILIHDLERRFGENILPENPAGIIILGGGLNIEMTSRRGGYELEDPADRLIAGFELQNRFPDIPVVYSGGPAAPFRELEAEALVARRIAQALYGNDRSLLLETTSRNTWENAIETKKLLEQRGISVASQNQWILITSAFHMMRAVGTFEKAGFRVTPWKTDYRSRYTGSLRATSNPNKQFEKLEYTMKEWIGIVVYTWLGRMDWPQENG